MSASERPTARISLFYSYSHKDEGLRDELKAALSGAAAPGDHRRVARPTHRCRDRVGGPD